jgi:hypothetical protein
MANDSCGDVMARRSFVFRGRQEPGQSADSAHESPRSGTYQPERSETSSASENRRASALLSWPAPWSVIDCQTTGLDARLRPIEIAAIGHDGRVLIDTLVNPGVPIPSSVTLLTGINDAAVKSAPRWSAIWPQLETLLLAQNHVVGWGSEFDLKAMRDECARDGRLTWTTAIDARFVDLAPIASVLIGRECSFDDACAFAAHPAPTVGRQRALLYCRATLRIIEAMRGSSR